MAGGSAGTASWGTAIIAAARMLRARLDAEHGGIVPPAELDVSANSESIADHAGPLPGTPYPEKYSMHAFGAQFAEVRVRVDSGRSGCRAC